LGSLNTHIINFKAQKTHKKAKKMCSIESTGQFLVDSDSKCRGRPSADEGKEKEVLQSMNMRRP
jgi:hypothetical protein